MRVSPGPTFVGALVLQAAMTAPGPHTARGILDSLAWVDDATKMKYLENTEESRMEALVVKVFVSMAQIIMRA